MSGKDIQAPKVERKKRRQAEPTRPIPVTLGLVSELPLIDRAARKEDVTRSDILRTGALRLAREVLGLPPAA